MGLQVQLLFQLGITSPIWGIYLPDFRGAYPPVELDPRNDVGDEVCADPPHCPVVHISYLEQGGHLRIPGTAINVEDISHPPVI